MGRAYVARMVEQRGHVAGASRDVVFRHRNAGPFADAAKQDLPHLVVEHDALAPHPPGRVSAPPAVGDRDQGIDRPGRHERHEHGLAHAMRGAVLGLHAALAEQRELQAKRRGARAGKAVFVVEERGGVAAHHADRPSQQDPRLEEVCIQHAAPLADEAVRVAQQRERAVDRTLAWNRSHSNQRRARSVP